MLIGPCLPAFALTGRNPKRPYTQGVALGWVILAFQAVVSDLVFWPLLLKNFADSILFLTNSQQFSSRPPRVVSLHKKTDGVAPSDRFEDSENSEISENSDLSKPSTLNPKLLENYGKQAIYLEQGAPNSHYCAHRYRHNLWCSVLPLGDSEDSEKL